MTSQPQSMLDQHNPNSSSCENGQKDRLTPSLFMYVEMLKNNIWHFFRI